MGKPIILNISIIASSPSFDSQRFEHSLLSLEIIHALFLLEVLLLI